MFQQVDAACRSDEVIDEGARHASPGGNRKRRGGPGYRVVLRSAGLACSPLRGRTAGGFRRVTQSCTTSINRRTVGGPPRGSRTEPDRGRPGALRPSRPVRGRNRGGRGAAPSRNGTATRRNAAPGTPMRRRAGRVDVRDVGSVENAAVCVDPGGATTAEKQRAAELLVPLLRLAARAGGHGQVSEPDEPARQQECSQNDSHRVFTNG